jgi:hypothetical protein
VVGTEATRIALPQPAGHLRTGPAPGALARLPRNSDRASGLALLLVRTRFSLKPDVGSDGVSSSQGREATGDLGTPPRSSPVLARVRPVAHSLLVELRRTVPCADGRWIVGACLYLVARRPVDSGSTPVRDWRNVPFSTVFRSLKARARPFKDLLRATDSGRLSGPVGRRGPADGQHGPQL